MSNLLLAKAFTAGGAISPYRIVRFSAAETVVQAAAARHGDGFVKPAGSSKGARWRVGWDQTTRACDKSQAAHVG